MNVSIYLTLTTRCQLTCKHCYGSCNTQGADLDLEKTISFLIYLSQILTKTPHKKKYQRKNKLILHGGEPTLIGINNLKKICISEILNNFSISLQTNLAYKLEPELINFIKNYTNSEISTSYDPKIRLLNSNFEKFQKIWQNNVLKLMSLGIKVNVNVTATKIFIQNWLKYLNYLLSLGIKKINIEPFSPSGRGQFFENELYVKDDEYFAFMIELLKFYEKNYLVNLSKKTNKKKDFVILRPLVPMIISAINWEGALRWSRRCLFNNITIFPSDKIYICPEMAFRNILPLGTLSTSPEKILSHPNRMKLYNNLHANSDCEYYFLCHTGCPINSHQCSIDGNCREFFKYLLKITEKYGIILQQFLFS